MLPRAADDVRGYAARANHQQSLQVPRTFYVRTIVIECDVVQK